MTHSLVVTPAAEDDLLVALTRYEQAQPGLGGLFLDSVESVFSVIVEDPEMYQEIDRDQP